MTNERLNHQGFFMRLGKINFSYLLVFYANESIDKVIPIEEITSNEIKLYGFPNEPFEMTCPIIN